MLAPIIIYTYNRIEHLARTVDSLKANYLAKESILIIVSDGCGREGDEQSIINIRNYINSIDGFKKVIGDFRIRNLGAIGSVLEAEKRYVNEYGRIISMEDDNVCSKNYLDFMNTALDFYENDDSIFSISGYCPPVINDLSELGIKSDFFLYYWNLSWGYGIWKEKYNRLHEIENDYISFERNGTIKRLKEMGGHYIVDAIKRDIYHGADFPDAWLGAKMTRNNFYTVVPSISKVNNIGSDGSGHHQGTLASKFDVILDNGIKRVFKFEHTSELNSIFITRMIKFYNGSILGRISRFLGIYHYVLQIKKVLNAK